MGGERQREVINNCMFSMELRIIYNIYMYTDCHHSSLHSPLRLSIDFVTEGHDKLPVFIAVLGVSGLFCV